MSYLDLLPEEPMPLPKTRGLGNLQKKKFCLIERKCVRCRKVYSLPWGAKGYTRSYKGRELTFCSWHCLREDEKERDRPKKGKTRTPIPERVRTLEARNAEDKALLESDAAKMMTKQQVKNIKNRIADRMKTIRRLEESAKEGEE